MRSRRPRRLALLIAAVVLIGLMAPAAPAQSSAALELDPFSGPPGTVVDATGRGLPVGSAFRALLRFRDRREWPPLADGVPITDDGGFETSFVVPPGFPPGDEVVEVCVQRGGTGPVSCDRMPVGRFRVTAAVPSTTSTSAPPRSTSTAPPTTGPTTTEGAPLATTTSVPGRVAVTTTAPPPTFGAGELAGPTTTAGRGLGDLSGVNDLPDLAITGMEITQGIQDLANDMPLVADRTTVLRVYVQTDGAELPDVSGVLQLVRGGGEIAVIEPDNGPLTVTGDPPDRLDVDGSLYFTLPPEAVTETSPVDRLVATAFVFATHPTTPALYEPTDANNYEAGVFELHTTGELTVHLLPMHMHDQPTPTAPDATYPASPTDLVALAATMTSLYRYHPVSGVNVVMGPTIYPPLHGLQLDWLPAGMTEWDLTQDGVEASVLAAVEAVWAGTSSTSHLDQYYGVYREDLPRVWGGFSNGTVAYGYYDLAFGDTKPWYHRAGWLAAHELGHSIGFAHVGCAGNESNPGAYPWSDPCRLAPVDPAGYYGWDVRHDAFAVTDGPTVISQAPGLHPDNAYPYMGYKSAKWADPWHWCRALVRFGVDCTAVAIPENEVGPTEGPDLAASPYTPVADQDGWIEIYAFSHEIKSPQDTAPTTTAAADDPVTASRFEISIDGTQIVPDPLPHVLAALADRRQRGTPSGVTAVVVGDSGEALAELELVQTMEGADPVGAPDQDDIGAEGAPPAATAMTDYLPWFDDAVAVQLRVDGQVVDERRPSPSAPVVEVTAPAGGGSLQLPVTIEWQATDPDGDDLAFDIAYSPDGGDTWTALASYVGGSSYTVEDGSLLTGGSAALFRVTARDGFHATSATSAPAQLADQPPQVLVLSPGEGAVASQHRTLTLLASTWDAEDHAAGREVAVQWSSDVDGPLGVGPELATQALSAGDHTITATAVDGAGGATAASVHVTVDAATALPRLDAEGWDAAVAALAAGPVHLAAVSKTSGVGAVAWGAAGLAFVAGLAALAALRRGRAARAA